MPNNGFNHFKVNVALSAVATAVGIYLLMVAG